MTYKTEADRHADNQARLSSLEEMMVAQGAAHAKDMAELRSMIKENTTLTADIASIMNFSINTASRIVKVGKFLSATAKILLPIAMLYGVVKGIQTGHFPTLKDLL
ncbi:MAG: hypothetical protein JWP38_3759 [Herbaspirillum sp.]|nr:hypothetical protein [Herbaspirillum sp.]